MERSGKSSQEAHLNEGNENEALWDRLAAQEETIKAQQTSIENLASQVSQLVSLLSSGQAPVAGNSRTCGVSASVDGAGASASSGQSPFKIPGLASGAEEEMTPTEFLKALSRREAPPPDKFSSESGRSFDKFVAQFEEYCRTRYCPETRENWTGELGRFLQGEILSVFNVSGGGDLTFTTMCQVLKKHCKGDEARARSGHLSKFLNARPGQIEPLYLYAYRLERLFVKAYPGASTDDLSLRTQLLGTLPSEDAMAVQQELDLLKSITGDDILSWSTVVSLLRQRHERKRFSAGKTVAPDIETPEEKPVWFTSGNVPSSSTGRGREQPPQHSRHQQVSQTATRDSQSRPHSVNRNQTRLSPGRRRCDWCGIRGHQYRNCWRRLGLCLRCGSAEHRIRNCPVMTSGSADNRSARAVSVPGRLSGHLGGASTSRRHSLSPPRQFRHQSQRPQQSNAQKRGPSQTSGTSLND